MASARVRPLLMVYHSRPRRPADVITFLCRCPRRASGGQGAALRPLVQLQRMGAGPRVRPRPRCASWRSRAAVRKRLTWGPTSAARAAACRRPAVEAAARPTSAPTRWAPRATFGRPNRCWQKVGGNVVVAFSSRAAQRLGEGAAARSRCRKSPPLVPRRASYGAVLAPANVVTVCAAMLVSRAAAQLPSLLWLSA